MNKSNSPQNVAAFKPSFLMVEPSHFNVSYVINPWMQPDRWQADFSRNVRTAAQAFNQLRNALKRAGCGVEVVPGRPGLPDMVFPANAAVVLDGRAMTSRFFHPQRRGEEQAFLEYFESLAERGVLKDVQQLPTGCFQEGAGDCLWDASRGLFWAGFGPRSSRSSIDHLSYWFGREFVPLELVSDRCYHLDVCFCPLSGGEILYFPPAFTEQSLQTLRARVPAEQLIEATEDDLCRFSINAICVGRNMVVNALADRLRRVLALRGYTVHEVDVSPFMLAGGAAACMTLRLDRSSAGEQLAPGMEQAAA
jgi:N-dimethylarginine dimethylaminohydrolase